MLGMMMGHETVRRDLIRARKDEDIAAVIFRIDSGGGESLTSDLIGHEVEVLAEEKPVVASMLDVAASGGYSIAYRATKIVADPMTITGSIGSISGKFNVAGMYNKIGITHDDVGKGPNAFLWSPFHNFTDEQWRTGISEFQMSRVTSQRPSGFLRRIHIPRPESLKACPPRCACIDFNATSSSGV